MYDFNGPSLDFLGSRKPAHNGIEVKGVKVVILPLLASLSWKWLQMVACYLSQHALDDELFSRINIDDFERRW